MHNAKLQLVSLKAHLLLLSVSSSSSLTLLVPEFYLQC